MAHICLKNYEEALKCGKIAYEESLSIFGGNDE